ncbi:MAG: TonB-dependent receptor [Bacteroidales bacterium]|nr:TonB-dependent receptor [Bacteroidales bacterium]
MKHYITFFLLLFLLPEIHAGTTAPAPDADTIKTYNMEEVVISSTKETNSIKNLPGAVSLLSPAQIGNMQINDLKNLSSIVPNMYIPDYGSKMTSAVYIRGIGARSSGQAIGMYVDNVPFLDKSSFDFDLVDIQRIEVFRGAQGTLYGRNAMGGIINIYTLSPFDYQGTRANFLVGNHGYYKATLSHYRKINDKFAFSVGGYYDQNNGFFVNEYTQKNADKLRSGGAKGRLQFRPNKHFKAEYTFTYDHVTQGAFPYGAYDIVSDVVSPVNFNDESSYLRNTYTNSLYLEYKHDKFVLSSTTGYQLMKDDMKMDQDFSPKSIFTLNQMQHQNSVTEEIAIKSNGKQNYQWSFGAYAFYNGMKTEAPVVFKEDGIKEVLQPVFDNMSSNPNAPSISITDKEIPIPGIYKTPSTGFALFHQSTYNNLFVEGLSITAGLRLDYEKAYLDYDANTHMDLSVQMPHVPRPIPMAVSDTLSGKEDTHFLQLLPKVALKYNFNTKNFIYASVAKGYKAGGYNIQLFADLVQENLQSKFNPNAQPVNVEESTLYNPEYTWNYEIGSKNELVKDVLDLDITLFYMDVKDIQLTKFVNSGNGRYLTNAGKARSFGVEATATARITPNLTFAVNYGYTNATFKDYSVIEKVKNEAGKTEEKEIDCSGNYIPYAPQHTLSIDASYSIPLRCPVFDQLVFAAQYNGAGKMYWTEKNDLSQKFYGLLNVRISFRKGTYRLDLWGRNLINTDYNAFYFESFGQSFMQRGKPIQFGAEISARF